MAKAKQASGQIEDQALRLKLKQKAATPEVQGKLAPFTTPGYWFPAGKFSVDKKPHSLSQLQSLGALTPDARGMDRLVAIAIDPGDKVRPRWYRYTGGRLQWKKNPAEVERIKDVQSLLIELSSILVEMGMLQP